MSGHQSLKNSVPFALLAMVSSSCLQANCNSLMCGISLAWRFAFKLKLKALGWSRQGPITLTHVQPAWD